MPVYRHKAGEARNHSKVVVRLKLEGWGLYRIGMRWRTVDNVLKKDSVQDSAAETGEACTDAAH